MLRALFSPSGGVSYHLTASLHRRNLWASFCAEVATWLEKSWNPRAKRLIVFGPSGGWTLPEKFLARFEQIIFVEPDPLARLILARRFPRLKEKIKMLSNRRLLPWFDGGSAEFKSFLKREPDAAILFSNLLGQLALLNAPATQGQSGKENRERFFSGLEGREWASYHDLLSARSVKLGAKATAIAKPEFTSDLKHLAAGWLQGAESYTDHETLWLSEGLETELATWQLSPRASHLIAFVSSNRLRKSPTR